jgi:hypothetical protein
MILAIKPVFDRKTQTFTPEVLEDANVLLVHEGFFVFENPVDALRMVKEGKCLQHWTPRKRKCVTDWLEAKITG